MGQEIYEYAVTFKAQVSEHKALNLEALERSRLCGDRLREERQNKVP